MIKRSYSDEGEDKKDRKVGPEKPKGMIRTEFLEQEGDQQRRCAPEDRRGQINGNADTGVADFCSKQAGDGGKGGAGVKAQEDAKGQEGDQSDGVAEKSRHAEGQRIAQNEKAACTCHEDTFIAEAISQNAAHQRHSER